MRKLCVKHLTLRDWNGFWMKPREKNIVNKIKVQERMRNYHKMDKLWHCQVIRKEKIWSIGKLNILEQLPLALGGPRGCTGVPTVALSGGAVFLLPPLERKQRLKSNTWQWQRLRIFLNSLLIQNFKIL